MNALSVRWLRRHFVFGMVFLSILVSNCFAQVVPEALPDAATLWNAESYLKTAPKVEWGEKVPSKTGNSFVREVFYEGDVYKGNPTRIFAYYGRPEGDGPFPAVLLIHGGGGKAFSDWAEIWAKRGYVALAMDLGGKGPDGKRLPDAGPDQGDEEKFGDFSIGNDGYKNTWTYQSIAAILRGHALLLAQKEVDPNRIAATGISWGGYLTCILAGVDHQLRAAVPVYGCGFLDQNSTWLPRFEKMSPEQRHRWVGLLDPSKHLGRAMCPMLFVNGTNDFAYPLDSYQKSYQLPKGTVAISITVKRPHGHIFSFKEVDTFIDNILLKDVKPLPKVAKALFNAEKKTISSTFTSEVPVTKAELAYTTDSGVWQKRDWKMIPATIDGNTVTAPLPDQEPTCYYMLLWDERNLPVSSPIVILENTRLIQAEWEKFWIIDKPTTITPERTHDGNNSKL